MAPTPKEQIKTPEKSAIDQLGPNSRGEVYDATLTLFTDQERGQAWRNWGNRIVPFKIFKEMGMLGAKGSEDWLNVVEHSVFVAAASLTLAEQLRQAGVDVDEDVLVRAAVVHDASKRLDIERSISREAEVSDDVLASTLAKYRYSSDEIDAAKNTGRLADRFITDPAKRRAAIESHSLEANILGYCDARTRGSSFNMLADASEANMQSKKRPEDKQFFSQYWLPYYTDVEGYLFDMLPDFTPGDLNEATIFATVEQVNTSALPLAV